MPDDSSAITMRLNGGLGNQLFQYAAGRAIALKHNCSLSLDCSGFEMYPGREYALKPLNVQAVMLNHQMGLRYARRLPEMPWLVRMFGSVDHLRAARNFAPMFFEKSMVFDPQVLQLRAPRYLVGYWQSEKYFLNVRQELLQDLTVREPATGRNLEVARMMQSCEPISLHVRRGDYVTNPHTNQTHGTCSIDYYDRAVSYLVAQCSNPKIFVFSDDPVWARENIKPPVSTVYLDHNGPDKSHEDLRLMSLCSHHIIANSSFSWWGAWLSVAENKIVCSPSRWFANETHASADIIPESWVKL